MANLSVASGQPEITREDLKRMVAVTGRIAGRDLGSTVTDVRRVMDAPQFLPPGMTYVLGGLYEQQQIAFHGLTVVLAVAAALVFLMLLYLYVFSLYPAAGRVGCLGSRFMAQTIRSSESGFHSQPARLCLCRDLASPAVGWGKADGWIHRAHVKTYDQHRNLHRSRLAPPVPRAQRSPPGEAARLEVRNCMNVSGWS